MPIAVLHIIEGRTVEQKSRLIASVTQAIAESLDAKQETVRVLIQEMPKEHFGIGGVSAKELGR
ncbi:2-hydroxymuconate tautomerase [Aquaspirillum sp. LM1]|jgi:4-oxalocrotonate tautomerase|uniref:2-hydroxymuconate tautomerase n=1 Tax=Aquaspirillum sp. LM1 TaxID=1938604 RepID=UPI000983B33E|nr:2-hydroxymuconate tautomerase [Aquaspirillum sp. LM1]AQR66541.1 2-hydroxymuconate tautomerase [Aquaspirillum sp. LM1]